MQESIDCVKNPDLCLSDGQNGKIDPDAKIVLGDGQMQRASSVMDADNTSSRAMVSVITVLSIGLVVGVVAVAYFWKKSNQEMSMRKDVEKDLADVTAKSGDQRTIGLPPAQKAFAIPSSRSSQGRRTGRKFLQQQEVQTTAKPRAKSINVPKALNLADLDVTYQNEMDAYEDGNYGTKRKRGAVTGSVKSVTDAEVTAAKKAMREGKGSINFKYKNLGGFEDVGNVHPKNDYKRDESNQCLWDIVMVRLSLINEDFVHRSRYTSGQPFGFKHDVLISTNAFDDEMEPEEVDDYNAGGKG